MPERVILFAKGEINLFLGKDAVAQEVFGVELSNYESEGREFESLRRAIHINHLQQKARSGRTSRNTRKNSASRRVNVIPMAYRQQTLRLRPNLPRARVIENIRMEQQLVSSFKDWV